MPCRCKLNNRRNCRNDYSRDCRRNERDECDECDGRNGCDGPTGPTGTPGSNSTVAGPTGPTGAPSTVAGPTGPTGAPSTVAGPTGPTGADSTVAGPTGPTGADSTVAGPTGPTGAPAAGFTSQTIQTTPTPSLNVDYTIQIGTGLAYIPGNSILFTDPLTPTIYIEGIVTTYNSVTGFITVNVTKFNGSFTNKIYNVNLSGSSPIGYASDYYSWNHTEDYFESADGLTNPTSITRTTVATLISTFNPSLPYEYQFRGLSQFSNGTTDMSLRVQFLDKNLNVCTYTDSSTPAESGNNINTAGPINLEPYWANIVYVKLKWTNTNTGWSKQLWLGFKGARGALGPTGATSTVTGPTGANSTVAGPTGQIGSTGPTGPYSVSSNYVGEFSINGTYNIGIFKTAATYTATLVTSGEVILGSPASNILIPVTGIYEINYQINISQKDTVSVNGPIPFTTYIDVSGTNIKTFEDTIIGDGTGTTAVYVNIPLFHTYITTLTAGQYVTISAKQGNVPDSFDRCSIITSVKMVAQNIGTTGPTGANSTVTGPTGANSTVTGPTGPCCTGPTGPAGPAGSASNIVASYYYSGAAVPVSSITPLIPVPLNFPTQLVNTGGIVANGTFTTFTIPKTGYYEIAYNTTISSDYSYSSQDDPQFYTATSKILIGATPITGSTYSTVVNAVGFSNTINSTVYYSFLPAYHANSPFIALLSVGNVISVTLEYDTISVGTWLPKYSANFISIKQVASDIGLTNYFINGVIPNGKQINESGGAQSTINDSGSLGTGGTSFIAPAGGLNKFKITVSYNVRLTGSSGGLFLMLSVYSTALTTRYLAQNFNFSLSGSPNMLTSYYSPENIYNAVVERAVSGSFTDTWDLASTTIPEGTPCFFQLWAHCVNTNCTALGNSATASKIAFMLENTTSL